MAFPSRLLNDGEEVVLDLHPHWWFLAGPSAALAVSLVAGLVVLVGGAGGAWGLVVALAVLASLGWATSRYLSWVSTNFVVTTDRLIYRHGVLSKTGIEIPLDRVNTVFFRQTLRERMMGAGDLRIESASEQGSQSFSDVRKPSEVQTEIYRQIEANENRKFRRMHQAQAMAPPAAPAAPTGGAFSVAAELEKLAELRDRGIISQEEFAAQKARLLAG